MSSPSRSPARTPLPRAHTLSAFTERLPLHAQATFVCGSYTKPARTTPRANEPGSFLVDNAVPRPPLRHKPHTPSVVGKHTYSRQVSLSRKE